MFQKLYGALGGGKMPTVHLSNDAVGFLGCHNRAPRTKWFKQQKCVSSQLCGLEIRDQGVFRVSFF